MSYSRGGPNSFEPSPWPWRLGLLAAISLLLLLAVGGYWLAGGDLSSLLTRLELSQMAVDPEVDEANPESEDGKLGPGLQGTPALLIAELDQLVEGLVKQRRLSWASPKIIPFEEVFDSPCHDLEPVRGPFYCYKDETLYIDVEYLDRLLKSSIETGELARGYILCRIMAEHLQSRLGSFERYHTSLLTDSADRQLASQTKFECQKEFFTGFLIARSPTMKRLRRDSATADIVPTLSRLNDEYRLKALANGVPLADPGGILPASQRLEWLEEGLAAKDLKAMDPYSDMAAP
ncbi:MAG TPA: hypothetical protein DDY91_10360 [Planctomycetaceae bacterium]|jgi:predicted metalloprotease|nr:hypothetical protein [Planctomycetaceae bacterium]